VNSSKAWEAGHVQSFLHFASFGQASAYCLLMIACGSRIAQCGRLLGGDAAGGRRPLYVTIEGISKAAPIVRGVAAE
jgi:hypothetical protein